MDLSEAERLLDPAPMMIETGVERCESGALHVAARTDMLGCTGKMFEWWFQSAPNTGRNQASVSSEESGRMCSSCSTIVAPLRPATVTGTISSANRPSA